MFKHLLLLCPLPTVYGPSEIATFCCRDRLRVVSPTSIARIWPSSGRISIFSCRELPPHSGISSDPPQYRPPTSTPANHQQPAASTTYHAAADHMGHMASAYYLSQANSGITFLASAFPHQAAVGFGPYYRFNAGGVIGHPASVTPAPPQQFPQGGFNSYPAVVPRARNLSLLCCREAWIWTPILINARQIVLVRRR